MGQSRNIKYDIWMYMAAVKIPIIEHIRELIASETGGFDFLSSLADQNKDWVFTKNLTAKENLDKKHHFFKPLVLNHRLLVIEYQTFRAELADDLARYIKNNNNVSDKNKLKEKLQAALALSIVLEEIFHHYLVVPTEWRYRRDRIKYKAWLEHHWEFKFSEQDSVKKLPIEAPQTSVTRELIQRRLNPLRLFILRLRRLLLLSAVVLESFPSFGISLKWVEQYTAPTFAYLAWLFFLPRLIINLSLMTKHLIGTTDEEKSLDFETRLYSQLSRRWPELLNDIAWFINGILVCFVLTGPMLPKAIYMALIMQWYDFGVAILRAWIEVSSLRALKMQYCEMQRKYEKDSPEYIEIESYLLSLGKRIAIEYEAIRVNLLNFFTLLIAVCLTLATFNPFIPIIGAAMAIAITVVNFTKTENLLNYRIKNYGNGKHIPKLPNDLKKPHDPPPINLDRQISNSSDFGFFPLNEQEDSNTSVVEDRSPSNGVVSQASSESSINIPNISGAMAGVGGI